MLSRMKHQALRQEKDDQVIQFGIGCNRATSLTPDQGLEKHDRRKMPYHPAWLEE